MKTKILKTAAVTLLVVNTLLGTGYIASAPLQDAEAAKNAELSQASVKLGACQIFPNDNFWNVPVDGLPVDARSADWINSIGASDSFHMDFGSGTWAGGPIGIPYNIVSGSAVDFYNFDFYYPDESDPGPYPLPASPKIEFGGDHHILTVDTDDCTLYEVFDASKSGGQWYGGAGAIWSLNSNAQRPNTWTSADAAGLPILPGLARYNEVAAGVINHALRFTAECTANNYIWPARHKAPSGSCANPVPFGARFRLKSNFNTNGYSPQAKVLLQAFKRYGIVLADNGSNWYVSGSPDAGWNNDVLHELDNLTGANFEAVDTSVLMESTNSAATTFSTLIARSQGSNDGWILESSEASGAGGAIDSTAVTLNLGDDAADKQYLSLLSFNTSGINDSAVITKITLKVKKNSVTGGGNPVTAFQGFMVDIKNGAFGASALGVGDFQATASKTVGPFNPSASTSGWYSISLTSVKTHINKLGLTQIRLRFKLNNNNNDIANFLKLYSGDAATVADRPQLIVEYYVP